MSQNKNPKSIRWWLVGALTFLAVVNLGVGFFAGVKYAESKKPAVVKSKTTQQYDDIWASVQSIKATHKLEMAEKELGYLKRLGCKKIMVNYLKNSNPIEGRFVKFTKTGDIRFIRLEIDGKKRDYMMDKVLSQTYEVSSLYSNSGRVLLSGLQVCPPATRRSSLCGL